MWTLGEPVAGQWRRNRADDHPTKREPERYEHIGHGWFPSEISSLPNTTRMVRMPRVNNSVKVAPASFNRGLTYIFSKTCSAMSAVSRRSLTVARCSGAARTTARIASDGLVEIDPHLIGERRDPRQHVSELMHLLIDGALADGLSQLTNFLGEPRN